MTPESHIRKSINAFRSESAWSPMPEHLLFIQTKTGGKNRKKPSRDLNKATTEEIIPHDDPETNTADVGEIASPPTFPRAETEVINKCEECDMIFRTDAMLTYHRVAFCVGKPIDENARVPRLVPFEDSNIISMKDAEAADKVNDDVKGDVIGDVTGDGVLTDSDRHTQRDTKGPSWCPGKDGSIPPFAVTVAETQNTEQEQSYVCLVHVGGEQLPATLQPSKKRASCSVKGQVFDVAEYSVLVDPSSQLVWRYCPTVGGIPRDAVIGGYDSDNLQCYIARGKAPDGTMCCGQYIPHKQQCYFAYNDTEYTASDFHFLCKKYSSKEIEILEKRTTRPTDGVN